MNYLSNPNPISTDFDELFQFDDYDTAFQMIMEEISLEDYSSSPTLSSTSSEKLVAAEVTSLLQTEQAISPMSLELEDRDEIKKRKRSHKEDQIIHVFNTKSIYDALEDGYKWRKYGKKPITGSPHPRHYYKCSNPNCNVKKIIERDINNQEYVLTTYKGIHNHSSPSVVYCDSYDHFDLISHNTLSFQNNSYSNYSSSGSY